MEIRAEMRLKEREAVLMQERRGSEESRKTAGISEVTNVHTPHRQEKPLGLPNYL